MSIAGLPTSYLDAYSRSPFPSPPKEGFQVKIMATDWGFEGSMEAYCAKASAAGYDGIETWWPMEVDKQDALFQAVERHQLDIAFFCGGFQLSATEQLDYFKRMVDDAAGNTRQRPLYINCHSGRDYFSFEENKGFIDHTLQVTRQTGIPIYHETHRSRLLFAAPVARQFLETIPELRLTLDASHWCTVSESYLEDQQETMALAVQRTGHLHARIGHPQGPQVNDPRAPEWSSAVAAHIRWWDAIAAQKRQAGDVMTILTEFGPPDYMPTLPFSKEPLADQWAINVYMMHLLRKRYS
jgi:sugar phosphate isomerase/epimerase